VPGMAELRTRIRDAAQEAGGYRTLARRSGGLVSHSTLNNIAIGRHSGHLTDERIRGIALCLNLAASRVAEMAGSELTDSLPPFRLPPRANQLSQPQRRVVLSVVDAILAAEDKGNRRVAKRAEREDRSRWSDEDWRQQIQKAIDSTDTKDDLADALGRLHDGGQ
jgi:hypothetical protein